MSWYWLFISISALGSAFPDRFQQVCQVRLGYVRFDFGLVQRREAFGGGIVVADHRFAVFDIGPGDGVKDQLASSTNTPA